MELVLSQDLEPLPERRLKCEFVRPEGLLNSNYKNVVRCNLRNTNSTSIFGIKQRIKSRQLSFTSSIETLLKVSVFIIALAVIL
ncbi:hypothetical protein [uncultured Psychroserpens sp.]|uniref:hypothetical protein n=1 Tax=uncultured Psychroserpens sp. TaxID=255436 RepID=UPI0026201C21|nr:hypothetical protein [uncultured Psychroserpens sp.]